MKSNEPTFRQELLDLIRTQGLLLFQWFMPAPADPLWLRILKTILKLPVLAFVLLLSPVLLLIVTIIFVVII